MARKALGEFEHLVLLAILRLGEGAYGAAIIVEVEERTGRSVNQAAGYLALRRLEEKAWISSRMGEPTPERGGRAKRYFELQPEGRARLGDARAELLAMWEGLAAELEG
jgi:DNA-binding PadR family transcriptional regulator